MSNISDAVGEIYFLKKSGKIFRIRFQKSYENVQNNIF